MASASPLLTVSTFETELDIWLEQNATGKDLFDTVCAKIGIREVRSKCMSIWVGGQIDKY
jgi:hypothetical protein